LAGRAAVSDTRRGRTPTRAPAATLPSVTASSNG